MPFSYTPRAGLPLRALALFAIAGAAPAAAQTAAPPAPADSARRDTTRADGAAAGGLVTLGSNEADRQRLRQLLGSGTTAGHLLRSASTLTPRMEAPAEGVAWEPLLPEARLVLNDELPFSLNDGAMFAGRGTSFLVSGGVRATRGRVRLILAPELIRNGNSQTDYVPYPRRDRSRFAFPWRSHPVTDPYSIDLPSRFGDSPYWTLGPGQSTLAVDLGPLSTGASTEEQWWGPGIRNALVMSNNAAGIPHLFLRTERPLRTRFGDFEGVWMAGALGESAYFDTISSNDTRSISAAAIVFTPAWDRGLSLGATRVVFRGVDGVGEVPLRALDAWITRVGAPNDTDPYVVQRTPNVDQIVALFGRWAFAPSGLEVYAEWARRDIPSLRELLVSPNHSQGYTLGMQWARAMRPAGSALRVQAELTYVEQSATLFQRYVAPWYMSRAVPQGYTQRGQSLGAAIGPGSSSQWLATDWFARKWQAGVFVGRIRWQDDFLRVGLSAPNAVGHDVSLLSGLRASRQLRRGELWAEYTSMARFNQFFQHRSQGFAQIDGVDRRNHTVRFGWSPHAPVRPR